MSPNPGDRVIDPRPEGPGGSLLLAMPLMLVLLLGYALWQGFYTVEAHEQAVVMRFGKYLSTQGPGLHFKIPLVDKKVLVDTAEHSLRMPYGIADQQNRGPRSVDRRKQDDNLILTGDLYAAVVEWNVIWRVEEPKDYLFSIDAEHVEQVIAAVARSVMHRVVGDYSADEILTGKREEIGLMALTQMQLALNNFNCGVEVMDLQMQRVIPPDRVRPAFDEVNASIQQRDEFVNEAKQERNRLIPQAEASADKLVRGAEGYAARRKAEATGEISALLAKYDAYKLAPDVTRQRLYLEAMERVIQNSGPKVVLDQDLNGLLPLLNLDAQPASTR